MKFFCLFLLVILASTSSFLTAANAQKPNLAALTKAELDSRIAMARIELNGDPRAFCAIEPLMRELDRRENNTLTRAEAEYDAAVCAMSINDVPSMWRHIETAENLLPLSGGESLRIAVESLAFDIAIGTQDVERYAVHVLHVAQMDDPGMFAGVDGEKIYAGLSEAPQRVRDQAYLAFAEASNFASLPPYFRQAIAEFAVLPAIQAGKRDVALRMISQVSDIDHTYPLLLDRRYAQLWPEIDKRIGPHQSRATADFVIFSKDELAAEPGNRWAFGDVVRSLTMAGRNSEAIAVYHSMPKDPQSVANYQPGDAWATNAAVVALDREERRQEADRAFDLLTQVPLEANPWMVRLLINRATRLADQGRWAEALIAAEDSFKSAELYSSADDQALAASNVVCVSAHAPGATTVERANAILLLASTNIARAAAALCRGDTISAKAFTFAALMDEDSRWQAVLNLQPQGASKLPVAAKRAVVDLGEFVRSDNELLAEFNRYGRFLPDDLHLKISIDSN